MFNASLNHELQDILTCLNELWMKLRGVEILRNTGMEQQFLDSHALIVVKSGTGSLMIDVQPYRLSKESVHVAHPGQTIGVAGESAGELDMYVLLFDVRGDHEQTAAAFPLKGEIPIHPKTQVTALSELIYNCWRHEQALERFRIQSAFQELLYELIMHISLQPEMNSRTALDVSKSYIETHYNENVTIEQLARIAQVSPKYYVDLFKKTYSKSAIDYLTEVRVNKAKQLMASSGAKLRDIAHQVGYNDEFYFSRKFKKEVGVSPTVYIRNRKRKIVAYSPPVLGQLLALNMIPYAAPLHPKWTAHYYKTYRTDIAVHLSAYKTNEDWESNLDAIAQVHPDIVISSDDHLHVHEEERLEQIAPIFVIPWKNTTWREQLKLTADYLGATQEACAWLSGYDLKIKHARERLHREIGGDTVLAVSIYKQECRICPTRGMREVLYGDLQLNLPPGVDPGSLGQVVPLERLAEYDADRILVNVCQEEESIHHWHDIQASPLWLDLKAVRKNRMSLISSDPWREYSASAIERMVDDMLRLQLGAGV